jgi:long-subunit fatty acid transport protein
MKVAGSWRARLLGFGLSLGLGLWVPRAWAGNLDAFYLSGDSALQAGAITADVQGGGAAWYNPAALSSLTGLRLDVSVNGYAVRFGGTADLAPPTPGTEVTRLTRLDLNVVPTALTITRRIGPVGAAIGVFVPSQSAASLRTHFKSPPAEDGTEIDYAYDASTRFQSYHAGIALGFDATEKLSLGGSFLVNYQTLVDTLTTSLITTRPSGNLVESTHHTLDSVQLGAEFIVGFRYAFLPRWRIAGVMRSPSLIMAERTALVDTFQSGSDEQITGSNEFSESLAIDTSIISPFRFHVGISHDFSPTWRGAVDASLQLPFVNQQLDIDLRTTWNVRAGVRHQLGPRLALGGGLFTDRSQNGTPDEFQEAQLDFYGLTIGLETGTVYGVYAKDGVPYDKPKGLKYATTFAFSYALGAGSIMQAQVATTPEGGVTRQNVPQNVIAHEFTLHVAQTVME